MILLLGQYPPKNELSLVSVVGAILLVVGAILSAAAV